MKVRELIAALEEMPAEDEVMIFDGVSQAANFLQPLDHYSVHMAQDLSCVIIEA